MRFNSHGHLWWNLLRSINSLPPPPPPPPPPGSFEVIAWCRRATSHYPSQCWSNSLSSYDVMGPQWGNCPCDGCAGFSCCCLPQKIHFIHDDVIKWKHFPRYYPFVRGIRRSPVNYPHKGQWRGALMVSLICALNRQLSIQSYRKVGDLRRSLWRHCNVECRIRVNESTVHAIETFFTGS